MGGMTLNAGWDTISIVSDCLDVVSMTRFDNSHRNACLIRGVRRTFQTVAPAPASKASPLQSQPSFVPFEGKSQRLDATPVATARKSRRLDMSVAFTGKSFRLSADPGVEKK